MPNYYFHYTSREAAQSTGSVGRIEAGASGWIYVSPDVYGSGTEVVDRLAIQGKPIDLVALIPESRITSPIPPGRIVLPIYHPLTGRVERKGGGVELLVRGPLASGGFQWMALSIP